MVRHSSFLAALLGLAATSTAQTYALTDLGTLPGRPTSQGEWINDAGEVSGTCSQTPDGAVQTAFVWRKGTLTALPGLATAAQYAQGHAINEAGNVVGDGDTGDGILQAFLYRRGKTLNVDANNSANVRGEIVGNMTKSGSGNVKSWKTLIWTEDAKKPGRFSSVALPAYPGGDPKVSYTFANAANHRLQVVGSVQSSLFGGWGGFWDCDAAHTLTLLRPLGSDTSCYPTSVNGLGVAAGSSGYMTPVVWTSDGTHAPSALPLLAGDWGGGVRSINDRGQMVGATFNADPLAHIVLWQDGTVVDLQTRLDGERRRLHAGRGGPHQQRGADRGHRDQGRRDPRGRPHAALIALQ